MEWKTERPTEPGMYWLSHSVAGTPNLVEVYKLGDDMRVIELGSDIGDDLVDDYFNNAMWAGPLHAPEYPQAMMEAERQRAAAAEIEAKRNAVLADLQRQVQRDTEAALHEALKTIPGASDLNAFDLAQHLTRKIIGGTEGLYFDDKLLVIVHPLEVTGEGDTFVATRRVERGR